MPKKFALILAVLAALLLPAPVAAAPAPQAATTALYVGTLRTYEHHGAVGATLQTVYLNKGNCDTTDKYYWRVVLSYRASSIFFSPQSPSTGGFCNSVWVRNAENQVQERCFNWDQPWPMNFDAPWNDRAVDMGVRNRFNCLPW